MPANPSSTLADNVRALREARGLSQAVISKIADVPRATWAHLETGEANPTLQVLVRVAYALQVSLEELVSTPHADARKWPKGSLPVRQRGAVTVEKLLPDPLPGSEIDRMTLPPGTKMTGVPHTPGTREYLVCEQGELRLVASGEVFDLAKGDVVSFRGDQRHSYENRSAKPTLAYSVVVITRARVG